MGWSEPPGVHILLLLSKVELGASDGIVYVVLDGMPQMRVQGSCLALYKAAPG